MRGHFWGILTLLSVAIFWTEKTFGQDSPLVKLYFIDSIQAEKESYFIYPVLSIQNNAKVKVNPRIKLTPPNGWKLISRSVFDLSLLPDSLVRLPLTLIRQRGTTASWTSMRILLTDSLQQFKLDTFLLIRGTFHI